MTLLKHRENIDVPERGERLVFRGGEWCPPDETIERSFYDLVSAVLGSSVATQIRSEIHANDSGILHVIPEQVAAECRELGMDVAKFNSDLREATRRELNGKFGPGKPISGSPPGIALVDAPIRLGFAE